MNQTKLTFYKKIKEEWHTKKYTVTGNTSITVSIVVEADSEDGAIDAAYANFGGIRAYCGNGGVDKLIGVQGSEESIAADGSIEFDDVVNCE